jgi:ATP-binding cassette, subfamily B, bacterial PglK
MIKLFQQLYQFLEPKAQSRLYLIIFCMFIVGLLDMMSIGMIIPLIEVLAGSTDNVILIKINQFLPQLKKQDLIATVAIVFACLFIVKNISLFVMMLTINRFVQFSLAAFQQRMFRIYIYRPYTFHLSRNTAQITRDLTFSIGTAFQGFRQALTMILESILVIAICILLIIAEPLVTLCVGAIFGLFTFVFFRIIAPPLQRWGKAMLDFEGRHLKTINESFGAIKDFKLSHSENLLQNNYSSLTNGMANVVSRTITFAITPRLFVETIAILLFLATTLYLVSTQDSLTGVASTIGLFGMAALRLMPSANRILTGATELKNKSAAIEMLHHDMVENVLELKSTTQKQGKNKVSFLTSIQFSNINFKYSEVSEIVLFGIDLTIKKGDVLGLVGQSGAGKSTLIDIFLGFLSPTEGHIYVDDIDIANRQFDWQLKLGFVPQSIFILDDSVLNNITIGHDSGNIDQAMLEYAISASNLSSVIKDLPEGVHTNLNEGGVRLSGGQRQRIGIARALYRNPEILVFDEATSSLDNESEHEINSAIKNLMGEKTIIIIAHRMSSVQICNRIAFMKDGRIQDIGSFQKLLERNEDFKKLTSS